MSDSSSPLETLEKQHRKERKELQAKIQALKKSVSKGDKKKKKEVTEESAKLEADLDRKHQEEREQLEKDQGDVEEVIVKVSQTSLDSDQPEHQRVSKAQRRRDKKAQKERDRQEEIQKQDEANLFGSRHLEIEKIRQLLASRGLVTYEVPSDGDCLYASVAHHCAQSSTIGSKTPADLRQAVAAEFRDNSDEYLPFLSDPKTGEAMDSEGFVSYVDQVENTKTWGGQLELRALARLLRRRIEVVQAEGPAVILGEEFDQDAFVLTYHRHMYGLGEHYNSTDRTSEA